MTDVGLMYYIFGFPMQTVRLVTEGNAKSVTTVSALPYRDGEPSSADAREIVEKMQIDVTFPVIRQRRTTCMFLYEERGGSRLCRRSQSELT